MSRVRERIGSSLSRERLGQELRRSTGPAILLLGGALIAALCLSIVAGKLNARLPWSQDLTVQIAVDDASGVVPGSQDVRMSGLRVGTISGLRLEDGQGVLELSIDDQYGPLYRDTSLRLRPTTPLQDMYVDIVDRGSEQTGEVEEDDVLPATRTESPVEVDDLLNAFDEPTRERFEYLLDGFGRGLDDRGRTLRVAFAEIVPFLDASNRLLNQIAANDRRTKRLVHNLRLLTEAVGEREDQLSGLVSNGSRTLTEIGSRDSELRELVSQLPPTFVQMNQTFKTVRTTLDRVDPALVGLRPAARALDPGLASLKRISRSGEPALRALRKPVGELVDPTRDLRPTASQLAIAFGLLEPQAPRLDHVTAAVVPCELGVQKFFQWTPSVFKYSDAHGVFPRGEATFGFESAGGLVADPNLRRSPSCTDQGVD